jgi:hypothetical protein
MYANWIETRDPLLSAVDLCEQRKPLRPIGTASTVLVKRLRAMANDVDITQDRTTYSILEQELRKLPKTWYPALLAAMVEAAYAHNVFRPGQIHRYVKGIEDKCELIQRTTPEPLSTEPSSPTSQTAPRLKRLSKTNPAASG